MNQFETKEEIIARELKDCLKEEAHNLARFVEVLSLLDRDRRFARLGYTSLFEFCTKHLCLTNGEAATRVRLAKLVHREPRVLDVLNSGALGMCCLRILSPILNDGNFDEVMTEAKGKTARELEYIKSRWQNRDQRGEKKRNAVRFESFNRDTTKAVSRDRRPDCSTVAPAADAIERTGAVEGLGACKAAESGIRGGGVDTCPVSWQFSQTISDPFRSVTESTCATNVSQQKENIPQSKVDVSQSKTEVFQPENFVFSECGGKFGVAADEKNNSKVATTSNRANDETKYVRIAASISEQIWHKYEQACAYANCGSGAKDIEVMFEKMIDLFLENETNRRKIKTIADAVEKSPSDLSNKGDTNTHHTERAMPIAAPSNPPSNPPSAKHSRYIPRGVAAEVWQRDEGRCSYLSPLNGRRCECRRGLQIDHIVPFARGGSSRHAGNLRLLCPTHNRMAADDFFGIDFMNGAAKRGGRLKKGDAKLMSD